MRNRKKKGMLLGALTILLLISATLMMIGSFIITDDTLCYSLMFGGTIAVGMAVVTQAIRGKVLFPLIYRRQLEKRRQF